MLSQPKLKQPSLKIIEAFPHESIPEEWKVAKNERVTDVFCVQGRKIVSCVSEGKEETQYHLKIIQDQDVHELPFPIDMPCGKIFVISDNFLLCVGTYDKEIFGEDFTTQSGNDNGCALLDLNKKAFVAVLPDLELSNSRVIGIVKNSKNENVLVTQSTKMSMSEEKQIVKNWWSWSKEETIRHATTNIAASHELQLYKIHITSIPCFEFLKSMEMKSLNKVLVDCDGQTLLCGEKNKNHSADCAIRRYNVDAKGEIYKPFFRQPPSAFKSNAIIAIPGKGYLHRLWHASFSKENPEIKILDNNFKEIATCLPPIKDIKKIHVLSDGITFFVEFFKKNDVLGVFKQDRVGKLGMELHKLPCPVERLAIDERSAQLICFANEDVVVVNGFPPLVNFAALDSELDTGTGGRYTPSLRNIMTGYLGRS